jgi:hypothetical protein
VHGMRYDQVEQLLLLLVGPLPIRLPVSDADLPREPSTSVPRVSREFNQSCDEGLPIGWNAFSGLFRALSGIQVGSGGLSCCPRPTEDPARPRLATVQHIGLRSGIQTHSPLLSIHGSQTEMYLTCDAEFLH